MTLTPKLGRNSLRFPGIFKDAQEVSQRQVQIWNYAHAYIFPCSKYVTSGKPNADLFQKSYLFKTFFSVIKKVSYYIKTKTSSKTDSNKNTELVDPVREYRPATLPVSAGSASTQRSSPILHCLHCSTKQNRCLGS